MTQERKHELRRSQVIWSLVIAAVGFLLPLILNQLLDSDFLHRLHKLLAYITAVVAFTASIAVMKHRARRGSPMD
ncbi:MAG: hypothetical protein ACYDCC_09740 [Actinomycetota bacterium]